MFITGGDHNNQNVVILVVNRMTADFRLKYDNYGFIYANIHEARNRIRSLCLTMNVKIEKEYPIAAIIGVIPLPKLYFIFATKAKVAGKLFGRPIYSVAETSIVAVCHGAYEQGRHSTNDRYRDLLRGFDFTRDFYFSHHYDLTHSLQHNISNSLLSPTDAPAESPAADPASCLPGTDIPLVAPPAAFSNNSYDPQYTWNAYLSQVFIDRFPQTFSAPLDSTTHHPVLAPEQPQAPPPKSSMFGHAFKGAPPSSARPNAQDVIDRAGPYAPSRWLPALVCGFLSQTSVRIADQTLTWTLLSRRARTYAGTRFLRRGLSVHADVANHVETELILAAAPDGGVARVASCTMMRGSIPLFWTQEQTHTLAPRIVLRPEADHHGSAEAHFRALGQRYGGRVHCVNLIKQGGSHEAALGTAFTAAVREVNARLAADGPAGEGLRAAGGEDPTGTCNEFRGTHARTFTGNYDLFMPGDAPAEEDSSPRVFPHTAPSMHSYLGSRVAYHAYDFLHRRAEHNVIAELKPLCRGLASEVGVFAAELGAGPAAVASAQRGVVRVNCVDCLDRTNVTMFCVAKESTLLMMRGLAAQQPETAFALAVGSLTRVPPALLLVLQKSFSEHGDRIAIQYAGSGAMHKETILMDEDNQELVPAAAALPVEVLETTCQSLASELRKRRYGSASPSATPTTSPVAEDRDDAFALDTAEPDVEPDSPVASPNTPQKPENEKKGMFSTFGLRSVLNKITRKEDGPASPGTTPSKADTREGDPSLMSKVSGIAVNGYTAVKRYYKNNITDIQKQQAISLFTGDYVPLKEPFRLPIWDLEPSYAGSDSRDMSMTAYSAPFNIVNYVTMDAVHMKFIHGLHNKRIYQKPVKPDTVLKVRNDSTPSTEGQVVDILGLCDDNKQVNE
jgi:hypothetical protein